MVVKIKDKKNKIEIINKEIIYCNKDLNLEIKINNMVFEIIVSETFNYTGDTIQNEWEFQGEIDALLTDEEIEAIDDFVDNYEYDNIKENKIIDIKK